MAGDFEQNRGKVRLIPTRPTDIGAVPAGGDRDRDHDAKGRFMPGNKAGVGKSARRALTAPLRAARARVREATQGEPASVGDELLSHALAVFGSVGLELDTRSVLVGGPAVTYATETILGGYFVKQAIERGLETEEGARLLGLAHACETQATRALTAAMAAAKAISGRKKASPEESRIVAAIDAAGESVE